MEVIQVATMMERHLDTDPTDTVLKATLLEWLKTHQIWIIPDRDKNDCQSLSFSGFE
jgi:hypothetical protein